MFITATKDFRVKKSENVIKSILNLEHANYWKWKKDKEKKFNLKSFYVIGNILKKKI